MNQPTPERWTRIEAIVDRALDRPPGERTAFVGSACGDDAELRAAVESWLAGCADPTLVPDTPAAEFAAPLLDALLSEAAEPEPTRDRFIGHYRIVRELGRGGMGTVYLAERDDGQFEQRVALKLMRRGAGDDERLRRRFLDERQILARLEHPHIATLLDGGVSADGQPFFVLQYVEGLPINGYADERALTVEERLAVFLDVCDAVQHAHRHQIVHRDLKPSNILVTRAGVAKLLDFGIAKLLEDDLEGEQSALTRTGERLLTPEYASPEQVRGEEVTPASDVYALGVLLHELLTGRSPYRRGPRHTPHDVERAVLEEEPVLPSSSVTSSTGPAGPRGPAPLETISRGRGTTPERLRRQLRGDLDAIVLKALRKEPAERYASAGELADEVRRHLDGLPIRARGRGPGYQLWTLARRHRVNGVAASAGLLVGIALLLLSGGPRRSFGFLRSWEDSDTPVLAVGRISDYREGRSGEAAAPLADMLATNLARTQGLAVVSAARMHELLSQVRVAGTPAEERHTGAARRAGATQLVDGAIYSTADGGIRLDLRRVDLASGGIAGAHSANGADLFALADDATARLVEDLGFSAPPGSIADVTTRSLAAYQLYTEGLAHYYAREQGAAEAAFDAAIREDSSFSMAAYFSARNSSFFWPSPRTTAAQRQFFEERMGLALRLAGRASDRERLMMRAWFSLQQLSPDMRPVAETLVVRYPREVEGHIALGASYLHEGDVLASVPYFRRAFEMDSASMRASAAVCAACEAMEMLVEAYALSDSLAAAEREARHWLSLQPGSWAARVRIADMLDAEGRYAEAESLLTSGPALGTNPDAALPLLKHWIRSGDLAQADAALRSWIPENAGSPNEASFLYFHAMVLRNQGRLVESLEVARRLRRAAGERNVGDAAPPAALVEAQTFLDMGLHGAAQALFDSIARWPATGQPASVREAFRVPAVTMSAATRYAAGDTSRLAAVADDLERDDPTIVTFLPRDPHLYLRGLLMVARGADADAIALFQRALVRTSSEFAPASRELARALLRQSRPREAVEALRPAARGWFLDSSNLHATLTETHELLAEAWEAAGEPDSADVHWRRVADAWEGADAVFEPRWRHARTRAGRGASR